MSTNDGAKTKVIAMLGLDVEQLQELVTICERCAQHEQNIAMVMMQASDETAEIKETRFKDFMHWHATALQMAEGIRSSVRNPTVLEGSAVQEFAAKVQEALDKGAP